MQSSFLQKLAHRFATRVCDNRLLLREAYVETYIVNAPDTAQRSRYISYLEVGVNVLPFLFPVATVPGVQTELPLAENARVARSREVLSSCAACRGFDCLCGGHIRVGNMFACSGIEGHHYGLVI